MHVLCSTRAQTQQAAFNPIDHVYEESMLRAMVAMVAMVRVCQESTLRVMLA
jgi:hypothetical protein